MKIADSNTLNWVEHLQNNVTDVDSLKEFIHLEAEEEKKLREVCELHPMNIPRYYLSLINPDDPNDPIRQMCVPTADELIVAGDMGATTGDPYGDDKHDKGNGILHKYAYTALIVATEYCAMYCRHCFRKRMVGLENDQTVSNFLKASEYIAAHKEIRNVVISGGDPFMLPTESLRTMLESLTKIDHLNYIRIGSRAPVTLPQRFFDDSLLEMLREVGQKKALYVPTHFNHANEMSDIAVEAVQRLRDAGLTVNNQAVLLKGVNDNKQALMKLMNGLVEMGVNPYYLYQCMPVSRVRHHFQVPLKEAIDLVDETRRNLDGYAKRFKFIMGHDIGKIEICGRIRDKMILKQIHARVGDEDEAARMLVKQLNDEGGWLDDFEDADLD